MGKLARIGLNTHERKVRRVEDRLCEHERFFRRCDAAAAHADVIFNEAVDGAAEGGGRRFKLPDVFQRVHADGKAAAARKVAKAHDLCGVDHLVGDEHILDAGLDQVFRFAQLGAGDALCAACDLHVSDGGAFVGFIVRAERHAERAQQFHHPPLVLFEHIKIHDERRGFQL